MVDWRPTLSWLVIEDCSCGGFFVAADALEWRLPRLTTAARAELSSTIQGFRAMDREAWLTTADGGISGRLVIHTERPDRPRRAALTAVPIERLRVPPRSTTLKGDQQTLYEITLSAVPSVAWRAAFLRPPSTLTTARFTPESCGLGGDGTGVTFRATPLQLHQWVRRIDRWIAYANSVVEE
jgi:hypothetical protein